MAPKKILLVDDDPLVLRFLISVVEDAGYTPCPAICGADALHIVDTFGNELCYAISDITMPGMDGRDLAKTIHEKLPKLPIMLITGYTSDPVRSADLPSGVELRRKPLGVRDLRERLDAACGRG